MNKKKLVILICSIMALVIIVCIGVLTSAGNRISKIEDKLSLSEKYLEQLEYEKALAVYKEILQIDPKNVEAYLGMADVYIAMNEYTEALGILEEGSMEIEDAGLMAKKSEVEAMLSGVNDITSSTIEPAEKEVEEVVDETVEDTTEEILEEVVEEPDNNAKPVDWTGYGEGQVSIMYVDGTVYEGTPDKEDPDVCVYTIIDADQQYTCDNATLGLKSYGNLYTYNSNITIDDLDESTYGINGNPNWFYHKGARESLDVHTGIEFEEDILSLYFIKEIEADDAYIINGFEIRTAQDLVNVFGKPFGIYYAHCGSDDATVGDSPRLYMYMYKVNDCILNVTFNMPNNNLNDCQLTEVVLTNPEYAGTLEEVFWLSE